jgi:hypothetical protein
MSVKSVKVEVELHSSDSCNSLSFLFLEDSSLVGVQTSLFKKNSGLKMTADRRTNSNTCK